MTTFSAGDPEPEVLYVRDCYGLVWYAFGSCWTGMHGQWRAWPDLVSAYGPLTEGTVIPE